MMTFLGILSLIELVIIYHTKYSEKSTSNVWAGGVQPTQRNRTAFVSTFDLTHGYRTAMMNKTLAGHVYDVLL